MCSKAIRTINKNVVWLEKTQENINFFKILRRQHIELTHVNLS
jgi:hypothetical protein